MIWLKYVFYRDEFLCTAISPDLADYSIDIKDIQHARSQRRKHLKQNIASPSTTDLIKEEKIMVIHLKKRLKRQKLKIVMTKHQNFIETKEYKRFAEFCDACIKYQYIGICYGQPGVGKTLSSRYYTNWNTIEKQVNHRGWEDLASKTTDDILSVNKIFYTAPAENKQD